jgi:hypothetical protein
VNAPRGKSLKSTPKLVTYTGGHRLASFRGSYFITYLRPDLPQKRPLEKLVECIDLQKYICKMTKEKQTLCQKYGRYILLYTTNSRINNNK